jgi:VanZ family protein
MSNRRLVGAVTVAYLLMIVYASLSPFSGWRMPAESVFAFLGQPRPRYITAGDIALNIAAYMPFGFLLGVVLRPRLGGAGAAAAAAALGALTSLGMESAQMFLPMRIASNVDLLNNAAGSLLGGLAAVLVAHPLVRNNALNATRHREIRSGAIGDAGLLLLMLWVLIQFHPAPLLFATGDLRDVLRVEPYLSHTPVIYLLTEAAVVAMAVVTIGLIVSLLLQPRRYALLPAVLLLLAALAVRTAAAATFARSAHWLQWLTPGVEVGLTIGVATLALLLRLPPSARALAAVLCTVAGVVLVNAAPGNPYRTPLPVSAAFSLTHLLNLDSLLHGASLVWPWLVAAYLAAVYRTERAGAARRIEGVGTHGR